MTLTDRMFLVTGLSSTKFGLMTGQLVLCPYRNRLACGIETDHSRPILNPREIPNKRPGFGGPFPCVMDVPIPDDAEVSDRSPSETPDLAGDLGRKSTLIRCDNSTREMDNERSFD